MDFWMWDANGLNGILYRRFVGKGIVVGELPIFLLKKIIQLPVKPEGRRVRLLRINVHGFVWHEERLEVNPNVNQRMVSVVIRKKVAHSGNFLQRCWTLGDWTKAIHLL